MPVQKSCGSRTSSHCDFDHFVLFASRAKAAKPESVGMSAQFGKQQVAVLRANDSGAGFDTAPAARAVAGSVGSFSWPGAYGTNWCADPKERLAVVFMAQTPGPIRWHYRDVINGLVNQAIVD